MSTNKPKTNSPSVVATKIYWITDGTNKAYHYRDTIEILGGYFVKEHSAWCIDNPSEQVMDIIKTHGMTTQFRKYKG